SAVLLRHVGLSGGAQRHRLRLDGTAGRAEELPADPFGRQRDGRYPAHAGDQLPCGRLLIEGRPAACVALRAHAETIGPLGSTRLAIWCIVFARGDFRGDSTMKRSLIAAVALAALPLGAQAQEINAQEGFYIGAGGGLNFFIGNQTGTTSYT